MARRGADYIAGAFNILGRDAMYGRNWGAHREYRFLHFECCYYQAIEFAIQRGLTRVEAGAQGPHKLQRGYLPSPIFSAHWIPDPAFRRAVAAFLTREREMVEQKIEHLASTRRSATRRSGKTNSNAGRGVSPACGGDGCGPRASCGSLRLTVPSPRKPPPFPPPLAGRVREGPESNVEPAPIAPSPASGGGLGWGSLSVLQFTLYCWRRAT